MILIYDSSCSCSSWEEGVRVVMFCFVMLEAGWWWGGGYGKGRGEIIEEKEHNIISKVEGKGQ